MFTPDPRCSRRSSTISTGPPHRLVSTPIGRLPGHELVWRSLPGVMLLGLPLPDVTLDYRIEASDAPDRSKLVVRLRGEAGTLTHQAARHLLEVLDFILPQQQTRGLGELAASPANAATTANGSVHQAARFRPAG